jgi:hypothetical protein
MLPNPRRLGARGHHAAMPYADVPEFVKRLRASDNMAARALEFTILRPLQAMFPVLPRAFVRRDINALRKPPPHFLFLPW